jgi:uncharacterized protein YxeA
MYHSIPLSDSISMSLHITIFSIGFIWKNLETQDFPKYIIAHDDTTRFPKDSTNDW